MGRRAPQADLKGQVLVWGDVCSFSLILFFWGGETDLLSCRGLRGDLQKDPRLADRGEGDLDKVGEDDDGGRDDVVAVGVVPEVQVEGEGAGRKVGSGEKIPVFLAEAVGAAVLQESAGVATHLGGIGIWE